MPDRVIDVSKATEHLEIRCRKCDALIAKCKCDHVERIVKLSICDECRYG